MLDAPARGLVKGCLNHEFEALVFLRSSAAETELIWTDLSWGIHIKSIKLRLAGVQAVDVRRGKGLMLLPVVLPFLFDVLKGIRFGLLHWRVPI